uniref:Uncharacterized protein n=1 Tax=Arundo donax TaxID=35708 RepID=A0A0A9E3C9_ARUDO
MAPFPCGSCHGLILMDWDHGIHLFFIQINIVPNISFFIMLFEVLILVCYSEIQTKLRNGLRCVSHLMPIHDTNCKRLCCTTLIRGTKQIRLRFCCIQHLK